MRWICSHFVYIYIYFFSSENMFVTALYYMSEPSRFSLRVYKEKRISHFPTFFRVPWRSVCYYMIRASINIAETNDISVVACVIRHNKTAGKKISIFVCTVVFCLNTNHVPETWYSYQRGNYYRFPRPRILRRYHTIQQLYPAYRSDEAINSRDNDWSH